MSTPIYANYLTFYGATSLGARRRALRFQSENLDYVLASIAFGAYDVGRDNLAASTPEYHITIQIEPYCAGPGSTVSGTRIILLERAAAMLKLPVGEAMAMAYADSEDTTTAAEQLVRLEVVQKERHRSVAAMKGATCRATGWPKDAKHGYEGANAEVWRKAWDYCDSAMRHEASDDDASDHAILLPSHVKDAGPPTVHLTLARMTATASVDCHDIMGNRQLGPGSYGVLRDVARLAGWKYACVTRPGEPRQTLLWVDLGGGDGVE